MCAIFLCLWLDFSFSSISQPVCVCVCVSLHLCVSNPHGNFWPRNKFCVGDFVPPLLTRTMSLHPTCSWCDFQWNPHHSVTSEWRQGMLFRSIFKRQNSWWKLQHRWSRWKRKKDRENDGERERVSIKIVVDVCYRYIPWYMVYIYFSIS